jgi:hypothetical protein
MTKEAMSKILLVRKFSAQQLSKVQHELTPKVAHFKHTEVGLGTAELETEPALRYSLWVAC